MIKKSNFIKNIVINWSLNYPKFEVLKVKRKRKKKPLLIKIL
jgi:hypothetical protein